MTDGWTRIAPGWYSYGLWTVRHRPLEGGWVLTHPTETLPKGEVYRTLAMVKQHVAFYDALMHEEV